MCYRVRYRRILYVGSGPSSLATSYDTSSTIASLNAHAAEVLLLLLLLLLLQLQQHPGGTLPARMVFEVTPSRRPD